MAALEIRLPNNWQPRHYQQKAWDYLAGGGKRACLIWHRRAGKDDLCLHHTACAAHEVVGNYVHLLPEYEQARKAIWNHVNRHTGMRRIDEAFPLELRKTTRDQEMFIEFKNGSTWQLGGSDKYNSIVGSGFAGIVFSEWALANPAAWPYFSPMLVETDGWAIFITTPRGHNHAEKTYILASGSPKWFGQLLTNDDTGVFTAEQLSDELDNFRAMYDDDYAMAMLKQEYFASFDAAIPGAIWADCVVKLEAAGKIVNFEMDKSLPVDTGWDLGRTDDTSIWFTQSRVEQMDVISHHSSNLKDIPYYIRVLVDFQAANGIRYGTHWLPHDARPRTLAAGGKSILQQFLDARKQYPQLGEFRIAPRLDVQEGIQAARATFPICRFHATHCKKGIESLRHYHREWDDDLQMFRDHPKHDWSSHDADAWRTRAVTWKLAQPAEQPESLMQRLRAGNPIKRTFGEMKKRHLSKKAAQRSGVF